MRFCGLSFPRKEEEPEQYFNIAVLIIGFMAWTAEPRPNLGLQMVRQSLVPNPDQGRRHDGVDVWPHGLERGHQLPPAHGRGLHQARDGAQGPALVEAGDRGDRPEQRDDRNRGPVRDCACVVERPHAGGQDRELAGGMKMVVGDVIEYDDMIEIVDEHTGIPFKPNVIMSTKNLTRGTSRSDPWRSPRAPEGLSPTTHLRLFGSILATASRIEFASKSMKWDSHTSIIPGHAAIVNMKPAEMLSPSVSGV
ncbi:hypothetical protein BU26DRAFT_571815 [Trematosphaeria pertusa]|uniref:Uncharacterized protein n=1 Tax=Trematosphaeria pertusa TaxID=390896 RepID=A0A6A6HU46_9PLEO|nr:uncharacterized protein BU26DRAFT_571815 [Trematosphaeria pertusa]KAF2241312.1 hypothetical protein BU26DRAFT_571815 [Trematosphaeria pertusa]